MDTGALGITRQNQRYHTRQVSGVCKKKIAAADFSSLARNPNGVSQGIEQGISNAGESSKTWAIDIKESHK